MIHGLILIQVVLFLVLYCPRQNYLFAASKLKSRQSRQHLIWGLGSNINNGVKWPIEMITFDRVLVNNGRGHGIMV